MQYQVNAELAYYAMEAFKPWCHDATMINMLRQHRERIGLNQEEMAERVGCSVSMISRWETGNSNIPSDRLPELAKAYECRVNDIFIDDDGFLPLGPQLKIRGRVAAGQWLPVWDNQDEDLRTFTGRPDVLTPIRDRYGVLVEGDSMNAVYPAGTVLECIAFYGGAEIESGRRVIVQRESWSGEFEVTVKELLIDGDGIHWLVPKSYNPHFQQPFRPDLPSDEIKETRIIGIVVSATVYE